MRFMMLMIPRGYEHAAPGTVPDAKAVAAMMKYNQSLSDAGVLISLDGLHPPSMGARVTFPGGKPKVTGRRERDDRGPPDPGDGGLPRRRAGRDQGPAHAAQELTARPRTVWRRCVRRCANSRAALAGAVHEQPPCCSSSESCSRSRG